MAERQPIRLLPLDEDGARLVGGSEDVEIPLAGVPGAIPRVVTSV